MAQSMVSEECVFEKLNELHYEGLIVIAKVLDFLVQDITNKGTRFCLFNPFVTNALGMNRLK